MTRNLANWDRLARVVIGAILAILALTGSVGAWGYLGVILIGTAFVSFCPLYRLVGLSTCRDC